MEFYNWQKQEGGGCQEEALWSSMPSLSSGDEEGEDNAFAEQLDMDLKGFNYEDVENLKLDDSSTVSV